MPFKPFDDQKWITKAVERVARSLRPDVVRIRFSLGEDWTGDPSVYFRIVLSDEASREPDLHEIAERVTRTIELEVKPEELGLQPYFNFRSASEQADLKEEAWA